MLPKGYLRLEIPMSDQGVVKLYKENHTLAYERWLITFMVIGLNASIMLLLAYTCAIHTSTPCVNVKHLNQTTIGQHLAKLLSKTMVLEKWQRHQLLQNQPGNRFSSNIHRSTPFDSAKSATGCQPVRSLIHHCEGVGPNVWHRVAAHAWSRDSKVHRNNTQKKTS